MNLELLENYLQKIETGINNGPFSDDWESLYSYDVPMWYKNAKIGVFYHWGVYTVPELGSEWYTRNMYMKGSTTYEYHLQHYGEHKNFGYKELIPLFKGENFNPNEWIDLAKSISAKYMIPVAEHHDGFQMYDSIVSSFNSKEMGPKRDVIKELMMANEDIQFGVSSHRAEHYWFLEGALDFDSGISNPEYGDLYWPCIKESDLNKDEETTELFLKDWLVRTCELVDLFSPKVVYFDWWIEMPVFKPYFKKFLAYYYNHTFNNHGEAGVVNYKHDGVPYLIAVRDIERGQFSATQLDYWQCCTSVSKKSWSHIKNNEYKTPLELIQTFIDVISKNGNLLLNSGPKPDGSIAQAEKDLFAEIGVWVSAHEEAIFETRPWKTFGEGDINTNGGNFSEGEVLKYKKYDMRFTMHHNNIYVFIMNPENECLFEIKSMAISKGLLTHHAMIEDVKVVTPGISLESYERTTNALKVNIKPHTSKLPIVFKVTIS